MSFIFHGDLIFSNGFIALQRIKKVRQDDIKAGETHK